MTTGQNKSAATFDKHFLWGASTAAHQVEGNNHNQWTVWELEHAKTRAAQASYHYDDIKNWEIISRQAKDPNNYVSAELADHYGRYLEDFKLLESMSMNSYRFSIEWSRIEPEEGSWDASELTHYREYLEALKKRDIEPVVTLFHFTLPVWFAEKGGFEKRANVKYFTRFVEKVMTELGKSITYVITINEPEVYATQSYYQQDWPPGKSSRTTMLRVINNLAYAHKKAAKLIHGMSRKYKVSFAKNSPFYYPGDNAWLSRVSAEFFQFIYDDYVIRKFVRHSDFLGVNYYFSNRVYGYRVHNPDQKMSDLHWDMHPGDIEYVIERLSRKYKLPIMITENGVADASDEHRKWWIQETLVGMQKAMKAGAKVIGYHHWSLIDNFEWAQGKWPRFGLAAINYATGKRILRPSAVWFGKTIKKLRGL